MHIALIRQHFDAAHGGAEAYAVRLAQGLLSRGHQVSIICSSVNADDAKGCDVIRVSKGKWAGPWRHAAFAKSAGQAAERSGAELTIALARALPCDLFRLGDPPHHTWMKLKYGPIEAIKKAKEARHAALLKLERELMASNGAKIVIANSEFIKRQMIHVHGIAEERIRVLRNPVDRERFAPTLGPEGELLRAELGIAEDELVMLFSGMDFERKGLTQAAQAFARLCQGQPELANKLRFLVVGKGDAGPASAILRQAGCLERMIAIPRVADIERYYAAANVFVLPTLYDPAANAVGEALACGTPVVTTKANGAAELIRQGDNGMVLQDRNDIERLTNAISRMLATERVQRSRQFVSMVRQAPTMSEHLDAWEEVLGELLRAKLHKRFAPTIAAKDAYSQQVIAGRVVLLNESLIAAGILKRVDLAIPIACFEPRRERLVKQRANGTLARYPVRGARQQRDRLFAVENPTTIFLDVAPDSPERAVDAFHAAMQAHNAGVRVALPLAAGSDGRRSFLVYAEPTGESALTFFGVRIASAKESQRLLLALLLRAIAASVASLHSTGVAHGTLDPDAIFICFEATGEFRITLSQMHNAHAFDTLPLEARALDLVCLDRALPRSLVSNSERMRFVRAYLQGCDAAISARELIGAMRQSLRSLEKREAQEQHAARLVPTVQNQGLIAATAAEVAATARTAARTGKRP